MSSKITPAQQTKHLEDFFRASVNTTTRERVFFNRLSFDLKIAAARAGYHLHLYEPDVDRDGFDIVLEDTSGGLAWIQTKAVLSSVNTRQWESLADFLRPPVIHMDKYGLDPERCGRGGGVILIEIDASSTQGDVSYSYTDYRIIAALEKRYLVEKPIAKRPRGKPPGAAQELAQELVATLDKAKAQTRIILPRQVFLNVKEPDGLLALMGLASSADYGCHAIQDAYEKNLNIDTTGNWYPNALDKIEWAATLFYHMQAMGELLDEDARLAPFTFNKSV